MNIFETKPQDSYSIRVTDDVDTILFSKDKSYLPIVGSYGYRVQKYPSDVDLLEIFDDTEFDNNVYKTFIADLYNVIKKIKKKPLFYFSEFKAGVDDRYFVDIGYLRDGIYTFPDSLIDDTSRLYKKNLLSKIYNDLNSS